jgi:hypothetical protein
LNNLVAACFGVADFWQAEPTTAGTMAMTRQEVAQRHA